MRFCTENPTGLKHAAEAVGFRRKAEAVGERSQWSEVGPQGPMDRWEVNMLARVRD